MITLRSTVEPVLGTRLDLQVDVESAPRRFSFGSGSRFRRRSPEFIQAQLVQIVALETERLANVFSVFDPTSELRRWSETAVAGSRHRLSSELTGLLIESARWQRVSGGAYNPAVGTVWNRWKQAQEAGVVPSVAQTDSWAARLDGVPYELNGDEVVCVADCTGLTFNSFAKGVIADRVDDALLRWIGDDGERVLGAAVNLGGDIALRSFPIRIGIENPARPYDNEPPLCVFRVADGGVATSGASRRPIVIDGRVFSHLIDPRTCRPVENGPASVTVVGASAREADVLATVVAVTGAVPSDRPDHAVALVDADGVVTMTGAFGALIAS